MHLPYDVWPEGMGQHNLGVELSVVQAVELPDQYTISRPANLRKIF